MAITRSTGILLPISSLPSKYGIGTLGKEAYNFIDFLVKANQSYWQVLPIGPTSYGDSPYQSFSSSAGNPYFIDLDILIEDGLLQVSDVEGLDTNEEYIDYGRLYETRFNVLYKAYKNGIDKYSDEYNSFKYDNQNWLHDYSIFMAIKKHFNMVSWLEWPDENIRKRNEDTLRYYEDLLKDDIEFYSFMQFLFYKQYKALKEYAVKNEIKIIGDLPIYVAMDSAEVWSDPKQFQLIENELTPKDVAGVPPDYFSTEGQLWGNPLYDWDYMKNDNYRWWMDRIKGIAKYFDVIRIDHFRGFEEYWSVPYGEKTAINGKWVQGPSYDFVSKLNEFENIEFIAEDLGIINEKVTELLNKAGLPGMRVLEFSMTADGTSFHCPHNHVQNCVCYVSTHDNTPIMGWLKTAKKQDLDLATRYYGLNESEGYNFGFIRGGLSSVANLFICQMQDYLGLDEKATTNNPGTLGNWKWRLNKNDLTEELANKLALLAYNFNRGRKDFNIDNLLEK